MSDSLDSTVVLLGLTGTGKTNFLVAFDVILDRQRDPDGLVHSDLAADRAYLQPLKEQWLRGEVFKRTNRQPPPPHQLLVRHPTSGTRVGFYIPDLAGETFDAQFVTRCIPLDFCDRLQQATGVLLFVHCDHNADHALLEHSNFIDADLTLAQSESSAVEPVSEWRLEDASQQTKLVDLLQFIAEIGPRQQPLRVAVMISAWDLVENAPHLGPQSAAEIPKNPGQFLTRRWPLLDQFLHSHTKTFRFRVFGVSARGGGDTPGEIARLTNFVNPSDRVILVDGTHHSNDLSRPVRWLLGLLDSSTISDD
ncbi:MAG: hypothetical protein Q8S00_23135 [Deltaproteobacteria bacterium]|nr:hypothetical protein [Deltaproteobacteria bacterium]